ncbi:GNAT family N-acetyltransferase [Lentibacter algarum]|uniref:GNAT family N-acetyltransferase n=1 Tax=Lentibacter algarum TaxID=576131 RepID=UPI001C07825F|nr:GNAT family N-acetyltransferase [Lentibacter algarum]MBU2980722.1 GNAT family N-acetyltransferase [Lentibacter algarum]
MTLRSAQPQDAAAIATIWNAVIRDTLATFTTVEKEATALAKQIAGEPNRWHVAEVDGQVVGFACYFQFRGGPGYARAMEFSVHLAPEARGKGLGRKLLEQLEAAASAEGAHTLYGGVSSANPEGAAFHEKCGFERLATLPEVGRKNDQWLDLHLYQKFL